MAEEFIGLRKNPNAAPSVLGVSPHDKPDSTFMDSLGASFGIGGESRIGSFVDTVTQPDLKSTDFDPDFNPFDDVEGYEQEADDAAFDDVFNAKQHEAVKARIDAERESERIRAAYSFSPVTDILASFVDPVSLLPGAALVRSGKAGYSAGKSALAASAATGAAVAIQESGLQYSQITRSGNETAFAIGGSMILGALIGSFGAKAFTTSQWKTVSKQIEQDLVGEVADPAELANTIVQRAQSVGAAALEDIDISDLGVGGGKAAQALAKATASLKINPGVQTMLSPSKEVRTIYNQMVDNPLFTKMNMEGQTLGPAVENLVKEFDRGALSQWITSSKTLYRDARKAGFQGGRKEFNEQVSRAGRRGDIDPNGNIYVTRAAEEARKTIFDPLLQRAKAAKLLPDDVQVTTAASYVTRLWNRQKLIGEEPKFRAIAKEYFAKELSNIPKDQLPDFISKADLDDYIDEAVSATFANLTGRGAGDVPEWLVPLKRGPLKERTFNIPDVLVEDFLENDAELILRRYSRTMAADVELATKFGRADMKDQFEQIQKSYEALSKQAKDGSAREALEMSRKRDVANLEAFRDLIRGTYRQAEDASSWGRISRAALTWNYIRLLGGVALSSLTDAARPIAVHGLRATMREALPALLSGVKAAKISRQDARDLGAVTESVLQSRLATLADLQDPYAYGSTYERFLSNSSNIFSKATGLSYWNDGMKTISSVMTQNRMARIAMNMASASKQDKAYLAFLGISENMASRISKQLKAHGEQESGIWGANVSKWDDPIAARGWRAALNKDVDRTIVTKGVADQPLWTRTNTGKLITQFKSFALASHQRVLIAGLQENPQRLAESMVAATAMGMMVSYLKFVEKGDTEQADRLLENPGLWIANGLDRTGILSLAFEFSNTAEKLGSPVGITSAIQTAAGDKDQGGTVSRYASRNALGALLGPSAGILQDFATISSQVGAGDLKKSGANAIVRQVPGASLPGARTATHIGLKPWLIDAVD